MTTQPPRPEPRRIARRIARRISRRDFIRMSAAVAGAGLLSGGAAWLGSRRALVTVSETRLLMGTIVNLVLRVDDPAAGRAAVSATFAAMAGQIALFDHRDHTSPLARLNRSGVLPSPPAALVALLQRAGEYSRLSGGAFDVTVKPVLDATRAGQPVTDGLRALVDYTGLVAHSHQVSLARPGMQVTLDSIAKGAVVDQGAATLHARGFTEVIVEAGGDLLASGAAQPWQVGVAHPRPTDATGIVARLQLTSGAVATSGDYAHRFDDAGLHHHIIDPRTGHSPTELASVTVLAPRAADADALSTTVMVLGPDRGLALVETLPHTEALLITKTLDVIRSTGFPA